MTAEIERRSVESRLSDYQFREYVHTSLQEGRAQFTVLTNQIEVLTAEVKENTALTAKLVKDTAPAVAITDFGKKASEVVVSSAEGVSRFSKLMSPIVILGAVVAAWLAGETHKVKDLLAMFLKL